MFQRHDATGVLANDFQYSYYAGTNRLRETGPFLEDMVYDGGRVLSNNKVYRRITVQGNSYVPAGEQVVLRATEKITLSPQFRAASGRRFRARLVRDEDMYRYDAIGNLVQDQAEGTKITWTPYGKVRTVSAQSDTVVTTFRYDGAGNRIEKRVVTNDTIAAVTRYLRDASGNVMAIYQDSTLHEQPIYGSARLGQYQGGAGPACLTLGTRRYELSNHLGNVLTVVTDNIGMSADTTWARVVSASDYYPFGLTMEGRNYQDSLYRYGFNGKEKDDQGEWGSTHYDYGFRIYSPAIARFLSVDPLTAKYPWYTPYQFAGNKPIWAIDLDGLEDLIANDGKLLGSGPFSEKTRQKLLTEHLLRRLTGEQAKILYPDTEFLTEPVGSQIVRSEHKIEVSQFNIYEELLNTVTINTTGRSANQRDITDFSANILAGATLESTDDNINVSSTFRDPPNQARVMYNNLENKGIESQKRLYRNGRGIDVINVYEAFNSDPNCSEGECLEAMELIIRQVGPGNVSKHAEDINILNTIDVAPSSLSDQDSFVGSLRNDKKNVRKVVTPPDDPGVHIEIKQPNQNKY